MDKITGVIINWHKAFEELEKKHKAQQALIDELVEAIGELDIECMSPACGLNEYNCHNCKTMKGIGELITKATKG